jgi:hypothetical protein
VRRGQVGRAPRRIDELKSPAVRIAQIQHGPSGRPHVHRLDVGLDSGGLKLLPRRGHVGHLERDVVDADRLLAAHAMDLKDRLILAAQLELDRVAMVLGADALLEAERPEERDVLLEAIHDQLDVVDLGDGHRAAPPARRYTLKVDLTV